MNLDFEDLNVAALTPPITHNTMIIIIHRTLYCCRLIDHIMATNSSTQSISSCELCSQRFSDPRMLPCLHSFCYNCLVKHFDAEKSEHACPTCQEAFRVPGEKLEALPKDLRSSYVAEVAEYEDMVSGKSKICCDRCGNSDDSVQFKFCCTCCKCLCSLCTEDHTRVLETRKHELIEIGEKKNQDEMGLLNRIAHKSISCSLSGEVLKFYCKTCSRLICRDCMVLSHTGHSYDYIEAVAESEKKDLLPLVEKAESAAGELEDAMAKGEKSIQNIQTKKKSVDDAVNKCFKELQEALEHRKETLLAKSSEIELSKITALKLQGEAMKKFHDEIVRVCGRIKEASEVYMPAEMLSAKGPMTEKLSGLLKLFNAFPLDSCKSESIMTDLNNTMIRSEIEKFGVITAGSCASKSTVSLYMPQAIRGKEKKVVLTSMDVEGKPFGRGGEVVQATIELIGKEQEASNSEAAIKDNKDGTYLISVTPQSVGEHQLSIKVENEHVKSSPFVVSVREPRNYTSLSGAQQYYSVNSPYDVALDANGTMFVAEYSYCHINVLNKQGTSLRFIGSSGTGNLQFSNPSAMVIRGDVIYLAEYNNHRVQKLTTSGEHILTFGSGRVHNPRGICIDPEGRIYVSESSQNRISVFGADGTFDHDITGNMSSPWGVAIDPEGNLHVANYSSMNSITVFSPNGKYIKQYGSGYLNSPSGVAIDPEGYVFVSEHYSTSSGLQIFSPQCVFVKTISSFNSAAGVKLDKDGFIYVCDCSNQRIARY